jgi:hypothetical protein
MSARKAHLAALAAACLVSSPALAENWVEAGKLGPATSFIDKDSATTTDGRVSYWGKVVFPSPQTFEGGIRFVEMRSLHEMDCVNRRARRLELQFRDEKDAITGRLGETQMQAFSAGTIMASDARIICQAP